MCSCIGLEENLYRIFLYRYFMYTYLHAGCLCRSARMCLLSCMGRGVELPLSRTSWRHRKKLTWRMWLDFSMRWICLQMRVMRGQRPWRACSMRWILIQWFLRRPVCTWLWDKPEQLYIYIRYIHDKMCLKSSWSSQFTHFHETRCHPVLESQETGGGFRRKFKKKVQETRGGWPFWIFSATELSHVHWSKWCRFCHSLLATYLHSPTATIFYTDCQPTFPTPLACSCNGAPLCMTLPQITRQYALIMYIQISYTVQQLAIPDLQDSGAADSSGLEDVLGFLESYEQGGGLFNAPASAADAEPKQVPIMYMWLQHQQSERPQRRVRPIRKHLALQHVQTHPLAHTLA